jgi:hypothetical protein
LLKLAQVLAAKVSTEATTLADNMFPADPTVMVFRNGDINAVFS